MTLTMLKAVLFDLDDTLLDWSGFTRDDWEELEQERLSNLIRFLAEEGISTGEMKGFFIEFRNRTTDAWKNAYTNLRAPNLGNILVDSAIACGVPGGKLNTRRCLEAYGWGAVRGTALFPEVIDVLETLREAGIKVGIVTNAYQPMWMRDLELHDHGVAHYFPTCRFSAADVGYLKPHPEIFRAALDCLKVPADQAVFVGDDPEADIAGAQAVGCQAVLRATRRHGNPAAGIAPDATISNLRELLTIFDSWHPGWRQRVAIS